MERDTRFDNLKFMLMILVIAGHSLARMGGEKIPLL